MKETDDIIIDERSQKAQDETVFDDLAKKMNNVKKKILEFFSQHKSASVMSAVVIAIVVLGVGWYLVTKQDQELADSDDLENKNPVALEIEAPEEPKDHISPLTGTQITKTEYQDLVLQRPLAIIVENHPDARPQSGLDQADIVYETLVEGGITRFVPVFFSNAPEVVGPVRSVRKYFIDLIAGLDDPLLMHIGGATSTNPEANALAEIQKHGMKSLGVNGGDFWRVSDRFAPHNAYTNTKDLWQRSSALGWVGPTAIQTWDFKDADEASGVVVAGDIKVNWGGWGDSAWSVVWKFDSETGAYKRYHLNDPHVDAVTGEQLTTDNVVVVFAPINSADDGTPRITYDVIGSGSAKVFRDGKIIAANWSKDSRSDRFSFATGEGIPVEFNRGTSWIMVVPVGSDIQYE